MRNSPFGTMLAVIAGLLFVIGLFCGLAGLSDLSTPPKSSRAELKALSGVYVSDAALAADKSAQDDELLSRVNGAYAHIIFGGVLCLPAVGVFLFRNRH